MKTAPHVQESILKPARHLKRHRFRDIVGDTVHEEKTT